MAEVPENTIFGSMTSRGAGKRKIKPTALLFQSVIHDHDSDDEDEDFQIKMDAGSSTASEHDSDSASNSDEDESESEDDEAAANESEPETQVKSTAADAEVSTSPICGVCIKQQDNEDKDEFMQCDSCGIFVHESCYGGVFIDENEDESTSTTSWFCEPCMYGLKEPPYCEFCPNRYGAFKRTDIGGRWVHLICALYTHGASFSAVDQLTGISWQEVGNSIFGKKACSVCKDKIEGRLGVTSRCESGMCKDFLHVTCAQKLGLLVDDSDKHEDEKACVTRYFYCKKHSHNEGMKKQQKLYSLWERQECQRISKNRRRKPLTEKEEHHRKQMVEKLERVFESLTNVTINIPTERIEKSRRARYINTSVEFFDKFESKAENCNLSRQEFRDRFCDINTTNVAPIPIGFSKEYIDYISVRDNNLIPEEEEKLKMTRELLIETKSKLKNQTRSKILEEKFAKNQTEIAEKKRILENFYKTLKLIGDKPHDLSGFIKKLKDGDSSGKNGGNDKLSNKIYGRRGGIKRKANDEISSFDGEKICGECEMKNDTHLMCQCDKCEVFYHIGCLNPPLTRLPKRSANCGWICHECNESDDEEDEMELSNDLDNSATRASRSRRPPVRHSSFLEI